MRLLRRSASIGRFSDLRGELVVVVKKSVLDEFVVRDSDFHLEILLLDVH